MQHPKIVLITGASSGIGAASSRVFAKSGHHLILLSRRKERLSSLQEELISLGAASAISLAADVRDYQAIADAFESLPSEMKRIDILINNAGLASGFDSIHEGDLDDWNKMIDTNVKGILHCARVISPGMVERKSGHIINVCSTAGHDVYFKGNVYCASKHAVDALTKGMRLDLHTYGIRVSQVSPGHVEETEFAKVRFHGDESKAKIYEDFTPLNSRNVAEIIYFMASQPAHVNIQDILVMGTQQANVSSIDRSGRI